MGIDSFERADLAALLLFIGVWIVFSHMTRGRVISRPSLTLLMNRERENWIRTMARRELRMIDTGIMMGLQQGTAFFASSALIALGGSFALLQSSDTVLNLLADVPFAARPSRTAFEIKVIGMFIVLAYTFFKFGWAYRLFNYCSILIGAVPMIKDLPPEDEDKLERAVERAVRLNVIAGRHFNSGLRGMFFTIAYLGWFAGPWVFMVTTLFILGVLVRRQFFSEARRTLLALRDP
ncbi:DUF599 domain-containing protein [Mesorhizobium xinjiangense]|uniref:DUF599 domain-containing protein n=1 Tax=Mesorhizobium xinjiangense TaxID=2678685 RepID=UPI0012EEA68E|nr:DUF599 family protein [Mesorhizobium xinjiangense]